MDLIKRIFSVKRNSKHKKKKFFYKTINKDYFNEQLPSYMMINDTVKEKLINRVICLKNRLLKFDYSETIINEINQILNNLAEDADDKIIENVHNYIKNTDIEKINPSKLNSYLGSISDDNKDKILRIVDAIKCQCEKNKTIIHKLDEIIKYIKNNEISYGGRDIINREIEKDKNVDNYDYDKDIINKINNWDKLIVEEIKTEYQKLNYITMSIVFIDKMFNKYKEIEENYHKHYYNKSYYNREINRLKSQIYHLCDMKNKKIIFDEIQRLRKDLYTKSKDKYDILYNNEVFMYLEKKCDDLLAKVNQRVVDIKKEQNNEKINGKNSEKHLDNINLRFEDLELSRKIIMNNQYEIDSFNDLSVYLDNTYASFLEGLDLPFNFKRNKVKTELVILYNKLNFILSKNKKEEFISIDHINFRLKDLVEAMLVRIKEVSNIIESEEAEKTELVIEKVKKIESIYLQKQKFN